MSNSQPNLIPTVGDCYESSYNNGTELDLIKQCVEAGAPNASMLEPIYHKLGLKDEVKIVQGWATSPEGPVAGKRIHHSWIEVGEHVIEVKGEGKSVKFKVVITAA